MGVRVRERPEGSGVYWLFINYHGRRKAKRVGSEAAALEAAKKIEARLTLGDWKMDDLEDKNQKPVFKEYATFWLETYIKALRRRSTYLRYGEVLKKYVYPEIGKNPLDEIKKGDIRNLLLKVYNQGLSKATVCMVRDVISGPMGYAVDEELIPANPVMGIVKRLDLRQDRRCAVEPMTADEVNHFLETCLKYEPDYHPFFMTAFRTGARLGELIALHWGDVDFHGKFIRIARSYRQGLVDLPKNSQPRRVDMSDQLAETLGRLLVRRKREALKEGRGEPVEIVFHKAGDYMSQNSVRNVFKRVLRKAKMRNMKLHVTRHTYASLLLSNGESQVYVKEQLGHSSIDITVDIYGHLIPSANREAVNRLDTLQPSATYTQPAKNEKPQLIEIAANLH